MARRTNAVGGGQRSVVSDRNDADPSALTPHPSPLTPRRRGVILLVVLAILSLFTLMLITYVMATAHHKSGYRMTSRIEQTGDPPDALLHRAVLQVIRGPRNPTSVMGAHSALEDIYGNRTVRGQVSTIATATSTTPGIDATSIGRGQIVRLVQCSVLLNPNDLDPTDGFFNGRLLTFTDGPAAGRSTRIVGSGKNASNPGTIDFEVVAVVGLAATANPSIMNFIINGRPFSGTGFGFRFSAFGNDPNEVDMMSGMPLDSRGQTRLLDAIHDDGSPDHLYALLPNHSSIAFHANKGKFNPYTDPAGPGGANEDHDAATFQDMLLAVRIYSGNTPPVVPLPSLHRPDLVTYWGKKFNALILDANGKVQGINLAAMDPEIVRGCILRPLQQDHPQFTGSNTSVHPVTGKVGFDPIGIQDPTKPWYPWDVDNDGDGVPDSIWVDLGMPVQTAPDGRRYKPLFAILCIDLDGKLNLNAHGNLTHLDAAQGKNPHRFLRFTGPFALTSAAPAVPMGPPPPPPQQTARLLRVGQGLGPPEISLHHLFTANTGEYVNLLVGSPGRMMGNILPPGTSLDGRYGESQRDWNNGVLKDLLPGPGMSLLCDPLAWVMQSDQPPLINTMSQVQAHLNFPHESAPYAASPSSYGTPPDLDGDSMLALDLRGQPLYIGYTGGAGWGEAGDRVDSAYELNLSLNGRNGGFSSQERFGQTTGLNDGLTLGQVSTVDAPFTTAELERLYRYYDVDASGLPDRLLRLAPTAFGNPATGAPGIASVRSLVTHASFDLPVPSMVFTSAEVMQEMFQLAGSSATPPLFDSHITKLLRARLKKHNPTYTPAEINDAMKLLLWPESVMGVKMDLNRPLGNGRDDNGNGVVDEADVFPDANAENEWWSDEVGRVGAYDLNNDGVRNPTMQAGDPDRRARQLLARHLYVLMMLLIDDTPPNQLRIDIDGNPNNDTPRETARAIAQWAINMVDFRDRDAIMTPFEFDLFPFQNNDGNSANGTWDVDEIIGTPANPSPDDAAQHRGLVWGVERPELVFSETIAWHDRRTDDTDAGDGQEKKTTDQMQQHDNDFDQVRRPIGPLFFELFNPNSPFEPTPAEFSPGIGLQGVDLGKRTLGGAPVWRVVVTQNPDPAKFLDPDDPMRTHPPEEIERSVYFVDYDPSVVGPNNRRAITGGGQSYYMDPMRAPAPPAPAPILPNRYAVIGPAAVTRVGEKTPTPDPPTANPGSTRRIVLTPNSSPNTSQVSVRDNYAAPLVDYPDTAAPDIKQPVAVIIDAPHRLSISEPTGLMGDTYYKLPDDLLTESYAMADDTPYDYNRPNGYGDALKADGTREGFRLIHLQRLANPLMPWDPETNPYLTVDTAPVDLTVFNGESNASTAMADVEMGFAKLAVKFGSRERGTPAVPRPNDPTMQANTQPRPDLWTQIFDNSVDSTQARVTDNTHVFSHRLVHTLGFLNETWGDYWKSNPATERAPVMVAGAPLPAYPPVVAGDYVSYVGDPKTPFPWLTWNNRPYASPMELGLVPATRSSRLLNGDATSFMHYSLGGGTNQPYDETANYGVYQHLLNLFHSEGQPMRGSPHLYRLLEYVQVPSKFVGTRTWFDPTQFAAGAGGLPHTFHPPFNYVSNYRDPGRMNINTIFGSEGREFSGIMDTQNPTTALQNKVARSRRGYQPVGGNLYAFDPNYPTIFAKPFRSYGGNTLVPLREMHPTGSREIDATLLRDTSLLGSPPGPAATPTNKPLFDFPADTTTAVGPFNDPTNNAYFRYQDLGRLSNMLTTRSNVYAIWITVGYFEVKYRAPDQTHPDGYELTTELGTDTGEIQRHRAFYIFDRSIPVGFQRGENHNVEDGIVLQRFIE